MSYDLGDVVALAVNVYDANGALADAGGISLTVTLPDATTASVTPSRASTGSYTATYTPTQSGRHLAQWVATGSNASAYLDMFDVRGTADVPLVSLTDVKAHLNITATTYDEELRRFASVATDLAERWTGRTLRSNVPYTEDLDGGTASLVLAHLPVISVTTVTEDGATTDASAYDVRLGSGVLTREAGTWTDPQVTYLAGYRTPPAVAVHAVLELVRHLWQTQRGSMPNRSQTGDDYNPALAYSMPQRVVELLEPLRITGAA